MNLDGAARSPEHQVRCRPPRTRSGGDEDLCIDLDGFEIGVRLQVAQLNRRLVAGLPDRALDLLELAAVVYGVDAAVSRGGPVDAKMGQKWHRRFAVEIPVRDLGFWHSEGTRKLLEETLMFLSGDRFRFKFIEKVDPDAERSRYFKFGEDGAWQARRILMFSGGLDSFAGALEEIAEQGQRVALISHASSSKIAPVQRDLQSALREKLGADTCHHIPVRIHMTGKSKKEGTHRSRSFLFATLGAITAQAFGLDRVSFHENGVVSLNLPPVGNVLGTRATRTTHPQSLARFTDFFSRVFDGGMRIDNPYFWRTKTEVVQTIARLGMAPKIADTRSCADVHNQTKQHVHCGRCSQCIDRRFAILAAGLERVDPPEAYKVDLLDGPRTDVRDREIGLSYMRNAQAFAHVTGAELERHFPAVLDAVQYLDQPPETALSMIAQLLERHGASVNSVIMEATKKRPASDYPESSLPRLYGDAQRAAILPGIEADGFALDVPAPKSVLIEIDAERALVDIAGKITLSKSAAARLLIVLAQSWLQSSGAGLDPLDYACIDAQRLAKDLKYASDEALRQAVGRTRKALKAKFISAGWNGDEGAALIENIPWQGYRLAPDRVVVRVKKGS